MRAKKPMTRAQGAGVKASVLARRASRFVAKMRKEIQNIAYEWDEVCGGIDSDATELECALDVFEQRMKDWVEYIKEVPEEL